MAYFPDRDEVADGLPEMAEFRPAIMEAWKRWRDRDPGEIKDIDPSTRAAMMHCFTVAEIDKRLGNRAQLHERAGLKVFAIRDYAIRFKKHDSQLISRNQETDQVRAFMRQQPLDGIPTMWNLEVGYILDPLGVDIVATNLVCPNGYKNQPYWHIALHNEGYELADVHDLFAPRAPTPQPDDEEIGARWKPRESGAILPFKRQIKRDDD